ncbi:MAG: hypothetical protein SGBAC_003596 [Bacillariaceae sp.]
MKPFLPVFCLLWAPAILALPSPKQQQATISESSPNMMMVVSKSRFERYIDKVFANADSNKDGMINFSEVYELVLKIYVQLNRQAPVPPPTKETVMQIYKKSDKNDDKYLTRDEFEVLVKAVSETALVRVVVMKLLKIVGAPLLAEYLIRTLSGKEWLSNLATSLVPAQYQEKVLPVIASRPFWRAALIVFFVISLGHIVLGIVDTILAMSSAIEEKEKRDTK